MLRSALAVVLVTIFADVVVALRGPGSSRLSISETIDNVRQEARMEAKQLADAMSADELCYAMVKKHRVGIFVFFHFTEGLRFCGNILSTIKKSRE